MRRAAVALDRSTIPAMVTSVRTRIICAAIRERSLLEFQYHGLHRVVAPYCHGISTRGVEVLRAVQIRGFSSTGGFGFGKLWSVADIVDARLTNESFVPDDPDYNPNDRGMRQVHCRV
jgi:hypothetical protein